METFISTLPLIIFIIIGIRYFNKWVDDNELTRKYLQTLIKEYEKDKKIIRKDM